MKREMMVLIAGILLMTFVVAQVQGGQGDGQESGEGVASGLGLSVKVMSGNYIGEGGQQMMIQEMVNNQVQLRVNDVSANCGLDLMQKQVHNKTMLEVKLSNGRNTEVKVMPDVASETALARLRMRNCVEGECSIELKEVGQGGEVKLAYEMKTERQSKFLGLFGVRMQVQVQVDAEGGEVIRVQKPWWAFLASEPEE